MAKPIIHPNWSKPAANIVDGFSLEITAKDVESLKTAAPLLPPATPIAVTFLPGEGFDARMAAIRAVRDLGFEPMPHFSARRLRSASELEDYVAAATQACAVKRCFVIAGDPDQPEGPYLDSSALIATGALERHGIEVVGIGGHPEGHPNMSEARRWEVLSEKCREIERRGMAPLIVTQFAFDAAVVLDWLAALRVHGIDAPVRLGVPGPAGIKTLTRFAARCGVGVSAAVLAKYGISIGRLLGTAGPDKMVGELDRGLTPAHGPVRLHFYPFGGLEKTAAWIHDYAAGQEHD